MAVRWGKELKEKTKEVSHGDSEVTHGDLLSLIDAKAMQEVYQVNLEVQKDWVLNEHYLSGQPTLVGTTILSLLNELITQFKPQQDLQVKSLLLTKPVIYHNKWPRVMHLFVNSDSNGYSFSLRSRGVLDLSWQEHAIGNIGRHSDSTDVLVESLDSIRSRCVTKLAYEPIGTDFMNAITGESFLSLSRRWDNHKEIFQGDDEWLIRKELSSEYQGDFERYPYHPAVVDAMSIRCLNYITSENFLPISYGKITYLGSLSEDCYVHIKLKQAYQPQDSTIIMDIVFLSAQSEPLLLLENYTLVKMSQDNQVGGSNKKPIDVAVKVDVSDKDILFFEGVEAFKRQLLHLEFDQLVVVTSDLDQLIYEAIPEQDEVLVMEDVDDISNGHTRPNLSVEYTAPENEIEKEVVKVWQSILGISGIGVNDNFVELGGNSLLAVQIVSKVSSLFEVDIRVDLFYQDQTVKGLSTLILQEFETLLQGA
ncbi:phosphopantetheine-binding protein [Dongshaea marina]|uniref:phosphopantetheine-binding protein n=1 Tax=Dongshaea marina TaxID=2047966 RepID=UPI0019001D2A|nr:phosphopantetheine-binding protein [Dongshaea marina]